MSSVATQFAIGADATGTDGICGKVSRVVVDPIAEVVTHLVVEPKHGLVRLVPLAMVDASDAGVQLRCTTAEFDQLEVAEETQFLPASVFGGYEPGQANFWPWYALGGIGVGGAIGMGGGAGPEAITVDVVPSGEVVVRRGEHVHATDGAIGQVQGVVVDPRSHKVTHVLLQEGHLWGRKEVAIPIGDVDRVSDGICLKISKDQVRDLPSVEIDHPG
jgi:sporulation protein YlmC with PRC-barrel domain